MFSSVRRWRDRSAVICAVCGCLLNGDNRSLDLRNVCFECERSLGS
jgi:hypothetical protein